MPSKYDQEGKVFSHVISKEAFAVIIKTKSSRIEGEIYKKHDERILDALNKGEQFLSITNAVVVNDSNASVKSPNIPFMIINRDLIEWIIPKE